MHLFCYRKIDIENYFAALRSWMKASSSEMEKIERLSRSFPPPSTTSLSRINMEAGIMLMLGGGAGGAACDRESLC